MLGKSLVMTCLLMLSSTSFAQGTFEFADSSFQVGQARTFYGIRFQLNEPELLLDSIGQKCLDSIKSFVLDHPELRFELGVHTDVVGWEYRSSHLTQIRAESLSSYLAECGVDRVRIIPIGYECQHPVHAEEVVNQYIESDRERYEELRSKNRRVVLKILSVD